MKITPTVDPFSGDLEVPKTVKFDFTVLSKCHACSNLYGVLQVVILQNFKWYDFLLKLHRLYGGTHLSVSGVSSMR
jgi:hypothetical protein